MKNQKGFTIVEGLLIIIVLTLISFAGWYVWNANKEANKTLDKADISSETKEIQTTNFKDEDNRYNFNLPQGWIAEYMGQDKSFLTLRPANFKAPGTENDWVVAILEFPLPDEDAVGREYATFEEFKKGTLETTPDSSPVNENLTINGTSAWKYGVTTEDSSPTGPPEFSGGYKDIDYYFPKGNQVFEIHMRIYQHGTINYLGDKVTEAYDHSKYLAEFETIAQSFKFN